MVQSFADHYGITEKVFSATGAFDPILSIDTKLFIDPRLLSIVTAEELVDSKGRISTHFQDVMKVVKQIEKKGDVFWKTADRMLTFPEAVSYTHLTLPTNREV